MVWLRGQRRKWEMEQLFNLYDMKLFFGRSFIQTNIHTWPSNYPEKKSGLSHGSFWNFSDTQYIIYILRPTSYFIYPLSKVLQCTSYIVCPMYYVTHLASYVLLLCYTSNILRLMSYALHSMPFTSYILCSILP